jgi:KDO2-lipid IV(A) lauroyltransferase
MSLPAALLRHLERVCPDPLTLRALDAAGRLAGRGGFRRRAVLGRLHRMLGLAPDAAATEALYRSLVRNAFRWQLHARQGIWRQLAAEAPLRGLEHLERALAGGRGAILLGSHVGPIAVLPKILSRLPASRVTQIHTARSDFGDPVRARFVRQARATLLEGGIVALMGDGSYGARGIPVDFFGRPVPFATGFARLAACTGAAVVPIHAEEQDGHPSVRFGPPLAPAGAGDPVPDLVRGYVRHLESLLRARPELGVAFFLSDGYTHRSALRRGLAA